MRIRIRERPGVPADWIGAEVPVALPEALEKTEAFFVSAGALKANYAVSPEEMRRALGKLMQEAAEADKPEKAAALGRYILSPDLHPKSRYQWLPKDWCEEINDPNDGPP